MDIKLRDEIMKTVLDLVGNFLYYGRKEDEDLPVGKIEESINSGIITIDEIVSTFRTELQQGLKK